MHIPPRLPRPVKLLGTGHRVFLNLLACVSALRADGGNGAPPLRHRGLPGGTYRHRHKCQPVCRVWSALHPSPTAPPGTICWSSAGTGTRSLRCSAQTGWDSCHPCCCLAKTRHQVQPLCLPRRLVRYATNSSISTISVLLTCAGCLMLANV